MTEDSISTLYRKPCPSCARQYARDSRACPFCGYAEASGREMEEDQERLYGEYLMARCKQSHDEVDRLRRELQLHPGDQARRRSLALAEAEKAALARDLDVYVGGRHRSSEEPPERAVGDKACPACAATVPHAVARCACGHVFGSAVVAALTCPHCTAPVLGGLERCGCGYPLGPLTQPSGIPGIRKR